MTNCQQPALSHNSMHANCDDNGDNTGISEFSRNLLGSSSVNTVDFLFFLFFGRWGVGVGGGGVEEGGGILQ